MLVVVVENQKAEITTIADAIDPAQNFGQPRRVHTLTGKYPHVNGAITQFRAIVKFKDAEIGQLHQGNFVRIDFVDHIDCRLIGQKMKGVQHQTEIGVIDRIHHIPSILHTAGKAPPRHRLVTNPHPHRHGEISELAQIPLQNFVALVR